MKHLMLLLCMSTGLFMACKKDVDDLPEERPFARDFYAQGEWRDTLPSTFVPFDYTVGRRIEDPYGNQYTCKTKTANKNGYKSIQSIISGFSSTDPIFLIRFSKPAADSVWTASELEDLFEPGRIFPISGQTGQVAVGFVIPWFVPTYLVAESGNAPHPTGEVKILSAEPYSWSALNGFNILTEHHGFKVKMQFHANLGRLVYKFGVPKVVGDAAIRDGEASLYFEINP